MLEFPLSQDRIKLARGLLAMLFAIMSGVIVVDSQLNSLTHQYEFGQLLNLRRHPYEGYSAYFFGNSYPIGAVIPLARIENTSREFSLESGNFTLRLPTKVSVDTAKGMYWLRIWGRQFVDEAYKTKAVITAYAFQLYKQIAYYAEHFQYFLQGESGK